MLALKRCPGKTVLVFGHVLHAEAQVTVERDRTLHVDDSDERDTPVDALLGLLHIGGP
jgi:hypothetical protein